MLSAARELVLMGRVVENLFPATMVVEFAAKRCVWQLRAVCTSGGVNGTARRLCW